jgi:D-threo-aldose 1-dehydrogenase
MRRSLARPLPDRGMMSDKVPGSGYEERTDVILRLLRESPAGSFDSALLAAGWNLLNQDALEVFTECEARGVEVHTAAIFASGLLAGGATYNYSAERAEPYLEARDGWAKLAQEHGIALPACVAKVVIGLNSTQEVDDAVAFAAAASKVPPKLWHEAQERGLLAPEIPLPPL